MIAVDDLSLKVEQSDGRINIVVPIIYSYIETPLDQLEAEFAKLADTDATAVSIDLREVYHLSSIFFAELLKFIHPLYKRSVPVTLQVTPETAKLFRLMQLHERFQIVDDDGGSRDQAAV
jgi:anti-anti-sigma regulatory factor